MAKETKGQFGALFAGEVPGVDMLPPDVPQIAQTPIASAKPVRPLAKSKDPDWMKTGILIRKMTNLKLRQYLLRKGMTEGQGSDDMSDVVDRIVSEWVDKQISS